MHTHIFKKQIGGWAGQKHPWAVMSETCLLSNPLPPPLLRGSIISPNSSTGAAPSIQTSEPVGDISHSNLSRDLNPESLKKLGVG